MTMLAVVATAIIAEARVSKQSSGEGLLAFRADLDGQLIEGNALGDIEIDLTFWTYPLLRHLGGGGECRRDKRKGRATSHGFVLLHHTLHILRRHRVQIIQRVGICQHRGHVGDGFGLGRRLRCGRRASRGRRWQSSRYVLLCVPRLWVAERCQ